MYIPSSHEASLQTLVSLDVVVCVRMSGGVDGLESITQEQDFLYFFYTYTPCFVQFNYNVWIMSFKG